MSEMPTAVWSGEFTVFGVTLRCHVLDNGQRVVDEQSVRELMEAMATGCVTVPDADDEAERFAAWLHGCFKCD